MLLWPLAFRFILSLKFCCRLQPDNHNYNTCQWISYHNFQQWHFLLKLYTHCPTPPTKNEFNNDAIVGWHFKKLAVNKGFSTPSQKSKYNLWRCQCAQWRHQILTINYSNQLSALDAKRKQRKHGNRTAAEFSQTTVVRLTVEGFEGTKKYQALCKTDAINASNTQRSVIMTNNLIEYKFKWFQRRTTKR